MNNKILIIGGSGLIGSYLADKFKSSGNYVGIIARKIYNREYNEHIETDTTQEGYWLDKIREYDVIINLAGATIGKRWTKTYKKEIYNSRIATTSNITEVISKNQILFNTSAVGYYGDCKDKILTEDAQPKDDFLSTVCKDWEESALKALKNGTKVFIMRFGIVASKDGGAFKKLINNHRYLLGSILGNGDQYFSPIHIYDLYNAINFLLIKNPDKSVFNFTIPEPVTNRKLTHTIAEVINRPIIIPGIPSCILRTFLGESADTLLFSQRAIPERLLEIGFEFKFNNIKSIIVNLTER